MKISSKPRFMLGVVMAVVGFHLVVQFPLIGFLVFPVGCLTILFSYELPEAPQEMSKIGNFAGDCFESILNKLDVIIAVFFSIPVD